MILDFGLWIWFVLVLDTVVLLSISRTRTIGAPYVGRPTVAAVSWPARWPALLWFYVIEMKFHTRCLGSEYELRVAGSLISDCGFRIADLKRIEQRREASGQ
jgi:hypothetical protein